MFSDVGGFIVVNGVCAERADKIVVVWGTGREDFVAGGFGELNGEGSRGGGAAVDEEGLGVFGVDGVGGEVEFEGFLVEALADSADAEREGCGLFEGHGRGDFDEEIGFGDGIFCETAIFGLTGVCSVSGAGDAVADLELLGDVYLLSLVIWLAGNICMLGRWLAGWNNQVKCYVPLPTSTTVPAKSQPASPFSAARLPLICFQSVGFKAMASTLASR